MPVRAETKIHDPAVIAVTGIVLSLAISVLVAAALTPKNPPQQDLQVHQHGLLQGMSPQSPLGNFLVSIHNKDGLVLQRISVSKPIFCGP